MIIAHATFSSCESIILSVKLKTPFLFIKPDHTSYLLKAFGSGVFNLKKVLSNLAKMKINLDLGSTSLQRQIGYLGIGNCE